MHTARRLGKVFPDRFIIIKVKESIKMEEIKVEEIKTKYGSYLLPALCLVVGILIGFLLSPVKSGRVAVLSNNTVGSKNGCGNKADDMMIGAQKDGASKAH